MKKNLDTIKLELGNLADYVQRKLETMQPGARITIDNLRDEMVSELSIQRELAHAMVAFVGRNLEGWSVRPGKNGGIYRDKITTITTSTNNETKE